MIQYLRTKAALMLIKLHLEIKKEILRKDSTTKVKRL